MKAYRHQYLHLRIEQGLDLTSLTMRALPVGILCATSFLPSAAPVSLFERRSIASSGRGRGLSEPDYKDLLIVSRLRTCTTRANFYRLWTLRRLPGRSR